MSPCRAGTQFAIRQSSSNFSRITRACLCPYTFHRGTNSTDADSIVVEMENPHRARLLAFYTEHNKAKLGEVDGLLKKPVSE